MMQRMALPAMASGRAYSVSTESRTPVSSAVRPIAGQIVTFTGFKRADALTFSVTPSSSRDFHGAVRHHMRAPSRGLARPPKMMFERFTEKAIKVVMLAQEEARRLGHNFVGTEQVLLGLIGESTGIAAKVLKSMGVNLKDARVEVEKIIGRGSGFVAVEIPFTPRAKRVLELSLEEARQLGKGSGSWSWLDQGFCHYVDGCSPYY